MFCLSCWLELWLNCSSSLFLSLDLSTMKCRPSCAFLSPTLIGNRCLCASYLTCIKGVFNDRFRNGLTFGWDMGNILANWNEAWFYYDCLEWCRLLKSCGDKAPSPLQLPWPEFKWDGLNLVVISWSYRFSFEPLLLLILRWFVV